MEIPILTVEEALKYAIQEEIKAYNLYTNTSKRVKIDSTRLMLTELAKEEDSHRKLLEKVIIDGDYEMLGKKIPEKGRGISDFIVASNLSENATPQEVLIFAMKEEDKAFKLYSYLKNIHKETNAEKLFEKLAEEEKRHKIRFEEEYEKYFSVDN